MDVSISYEKTSEIHSWTQMITGYNGKFRWRGWKGATESISFFKEHSNV